MLVVFGANLKPPVKEEDRAGLITYSGKHSREMGFFFKKRVFPSERQLWLQGGSTSDATL